MNKMTSIFDRWMSLFPECITIKKYVERSMCLASKYLGDSLTFAFCSAKVSDISRYYCRSFVRLFFFIAYRIGFVSSVVNL